MDQQNKTFFVPERVSRMPICSLPRSAELTAAIEALGIDTLGDLRSVCRGDLPRVSIAWCGLHLEFLALIREATNRSHAAVSLCDPHPAPPRRQAHRISDPVEEILRESCARRRRDPSEDWIHFSAEAGQRSLSTLTLSVRPRRLLEELGVRSLGDLNGRRYSDLRAQRNFGSFTIKELKRLVSALEPLPQSPAGAPPTIIRGRIDVAASWRELKLSDLPMSSRLKGALTRRGATRIGDLHGSALREWMGLDNFGRRTIRELVRLLERMRGGEFDPAPAEFSPAVFAALISRLDGLIAQLRKRRRRVFILCLSEQGGRIPSMAAVGRVVGVTRERVGQIHREDPERIRRGGGPPMVSQIYTAADECRRRETPLTTDLIAQWITVAGAPVQFAPSFYFHALHALAADRLTGQAE